jgi:phenylalanyl-tRNA synthetase beta chain
MLASFNWLKEYIKIDLSITELAKKLTSIGLEVSDIKTINSPIKGLVVGEVVEKKKHPNADYLYLTKIRHLDKEKEVVSQVVCGANNIAEKQKILLATVGTALREDWIIKKAKIRGMESKGMVCSKAELGLEEKNEDIWVLPKEASLIDDPQKFRGKIDFILNLEISSNRWDCMNIVNIAREISALTEHSWHLPSLEIKFPSQKSAFLVNIENKDYCYRYLGVEISQIKVSPSPTWLQERLYHHGFRSINNIIDVTNLALLEYGQPIHAFDADKIGHNIIIRQAKENEKINLLDGKNINLRKNDLVIADQQKVIALGGVMGGLNSAISETTKNIFVEVGVFAPKLIKETAQFHKIDSEASRYYQHFVNVDFSEQVIKRVAKLMCELGGGKISCAIIDNFPNKDIIKPIKIILDFSFLNKTLGFIIKKEKVQKILSSLYFEIITINNEIIEVVVPKHRPDILYQWDLVEEIARLYGYDNIPSSCPKITNAFGTLQKSPVRKKDAQIKKINHSCLYLGFQEILTYPFIENNFGDMYSARENFLKPLNPVWNDVSLLRNDLLFGFMKTIKHNTEKKVQGFNKIFEI